MPSLRSGVFGPWQRSRRQRREALGKFVELPVSGQRGRLGPGLAALAFLLSFALVEIPLRSSIAPEPASDAFHMPRDATSLEELERIVMRMAARENR